MTIRQLELPRFYVRVIERRDSDLRAFRELAVRISKDGIDLLGPPNHCRMRCSWCGATTDNVGWMLDHVKIHREP